MCGTSKNLNIHHMTYERLGNEDFNDLVYLCKDCHSNLHKAIDTEKSNFLSELSGKSKLIKKPQRKSCSSCTEYSKYKCSLGFKNVKQTCVHHRIDKEKVKRINDPYIRTRSRKRISRASEEDRENSKYKNGFGNLKIEIVDLSRYRELRL